MISMRTDQRRERRRGNRRGRNRGRRAFSLIELIAVLIILGIMGALAGLGLQYIAAGFVSAREAGSGAQDAQLAVARLLQEFTANCTVSGTSATSIQYTTQHDGSNHTLSWSGTAGDPLMLDSDALVGNVDSFAVSYDGQVMDLRLRLAETDSVEYHLEVYP